MKTLKITLITISVLFASVMTNLIMFKNLDQLHLMAGITFISMPLLLALSLLISLKK